VSARIVSGGKPSARRRGDVGVVGLGDGVSGIALGTGDSDG